MNQIKITPLYKEVINGQNLKGDEIYIDIEPITEITPDTLKAIDTNLRIDDLYGFNANIDCTSKAYIIFKDFDYFTLATYNNTDAILSNIKIYNVNDFCRFNNIKINRVDIENASALFVGCEVNEIYNGIESYHEKNVEIEHISIYKDVDLRDCDIKNLFIYSKNTKINIQNTKINRFELKNETNDVYIWEYSEVNNFILSNKLEKLKLNDSIIQTIKGTRNLLIKEYSNDYSNIRTINDIYENNIECKNRDSYELIKRSYLRIGDIYKVSHYSYLISDLSLKYEKNIPTKIAMYVLKKSCGYGYKLKNAIFFTIFVILFFSLLYFLLPLFNEDILGLNQTENLSLVYKFLQSIYHSIITFATLGYGDTVGTGWVIRFLSGIESLIGIYAMSIVVYTITKKYNISK